MKSAKFAKECRRQSLLAKKRELRHNNLARFLENATKDIEDWKI